MKVFARAMLLMLSGLAYACTPVVADMPQTGTELLGRPVRPDAGPPVRNSTESDVIIVRRWAAPPLRIDLGELREAVIRETNRARGRAGAAPLERAPALARAARRYARELARRLEIHHVSATPGRETFRDRVEAEGIDPRIAGENLARLTAAPERLARRVVDAWLDSTGHRRNLLDTIFTRTGVGVMLGRDGVWYVVQYYATPR